MPPERHIAETYGVSRTIVREALLMLELQGRWIFVRIRGVCHAHSHENDSEEEQLLSSDVGPFEILQRAQLLESIAAFAAKWPPAPISTI